MIRENGGWNAFRMTPIKEYPCKSYHDAIMEEDRIRLEWNIKPYKPRGTSVVKTQIKDKINDNTLQDITLQNNTTQDDNTNMQDDNTMTQDDNTTQEQEIQDDNTTQEQEIQDDNTTLQERTTHNTTIQDDNTTHNTTIQDDKTQDDNTQDDNTTQDDKTQDDKTTLQERIIIEPILKLRKLQVEISKEDELKRYYSRVLKKIKSLKSKHIFLKNKTLKHLIS
jgi:cobalamin biosynthesis protein CobT